MTRGWVRRRLDSLGRFDPGVEKQRDVAQSLSAARELHLDGKQSSGGHGDRDREASTQGLGEPAPPLAHDSPDQTSSS